MRRATASGLIGLAILLCTPRPASAQWGIIKWLEELSGPGHMVLQQIDVTFLCLGKGPDKLPFCAQDRTPLLDGSPDNDLQKWKRVRWYFVGTYTGPWWTGTGTNPLTYPDDTKKDHVTVHGVTGGVARRISVVTDVAVASGVMHFSGSTTTGSYKWIVDPYVLIRPLATLNDRLERLIELKLDATWFPQGFTLDDFGATGGSLKGQAEWITSIGVRINLEAVFWR